MSETVNVKEAAALMCVHPKTVLEKIASFELGAARIGKGYVIMRRDVISLVEREIARQVAAKMGGKKAAGKAKA